MEVVGENYSVKQLRSWLRALNCPTSGNKADLILRLNRIEVEKRGKCPVDEETENDDLDDATFNIELEGNESASGYTNEGRVIENNNSELLESLEQIQVELVKLQKKYEMVAIENASLKKQLPQKNDCPQDPSLITSYGLLKEIMAEYNGETNVNIWVTQFQNIEKLYRLDINTARALLVSKLKGKAQQWLQSMPDYVIQDPSTILQAMVSNFGCLGESKLQQRQAFENRKWANNETFAQYCHDKTALANYLSMQEDELVEYIVDGIPDPRLRDQANISCLTSKEQLLRAFGKVNLKPPMRKPVINDADVRCFNCNATGHRSMDCKKPKREKGSCYGCGSKQHFIIDCPEYKKPKPVMIVNAEADNDFVRTFLINLQANPDISMFVECLIDSGSPICIIKMKMINKFKNYIENYYNGETYVGLNKTVLKVYGKIKCFININSKCISFDFLVVNNESMGYDAILGRNFLRKGSIKLTLNGYEEPKENISELKDDKQNLKKSIVTEKIKKNVTNKLQKNVRINLEKNINRNVEKIFKESRKRKINNENIESNINFKKLKINENRILKEDRKITLEYCENEQIENNGVKETCKIIDTDNFDCECLAIEFDIESEKYNFEIDKSLSRYHKEIQTLFEEYYVNPVRPERPRNELQMQIILQNPKPFHYAPRRLSHSEKLELQKMLDEYISKNIIKPSASEYASPIILVKKKNGELRLCVDFRTLNKMTVRDNYPLPLIEDLIDKLGKKVYFTKLDLKNGFFHVSVHPNSQKLTSFVTPLGQFEFTKMPFGLKNAPSVFQRFVNLIFTDMIRKDEIIIYMDDILIATETLDEHFHLLKKVLKKVVENKLELRIDKCELLQTKISFLGYKVTGNGIQPNDRGIEAVKNFPTPKTIHDVRSFLGLCSYFRKFVKNFSVLGKPLYDLVKKNADFVFGNKELECFELLKGKLLDTPVLAIYDPNDITELHCDASKSGFGAILMQKKEDGHMHPIFYFSKRTSEPESKYTSFELETLAIIYALQRFRIYLQGIKFKILTDCNSLTQTLSKKELNPRIARWALELQNYDYSLEHRSGKQMPHVDALSRNSNILIIHSNSFEDNLILCQGQDQKLCNIMQELEKSEHKHYELRNGVLYRKTNKKEILFYVPEKMEMQVMHKYHDEMGHVGVSKTLDLIQKTYWFPNAKEKVEIYIDNCLKCIAYSHKNGRFEGFLNNIPKYNTPFNVIHIDHYGPIEKNARSKKHILVIIDAFSKFVRLYPTKTTKSSEAITALKDYFRSYSRPKCVISDRGSCFTSAEFDEFLKSFNIQHIKIATGSPKANGQVERVNRILGPMIAKICDNDSKIFWENSLTDVEYALNNTKCRSTNDYPSVLLFGVKQHGNTIDALAENIMSNIIETDYRNLEEVRQKASEQQTKVQTYNKTYFDKKRKKPIEYSLGDYVMLKNFDSQTKGPKKLIPKYKGPYKIAKILRNNRFIIKDVDNFQLTQMPYLGVWAGENIRPWCSGNRVKLL